ncbi:hypothetical protein [Novosphingobium sp. TCA1]|uniref:hypothetical protein n=1 Tax=Novosphingobium sp. TCA1 TaxID=2682474 RepID=UPI00130675DE|nr:hypothetical protein [Novosphingobium sp. TCA1]GFE77801.1 hypothetical protein NTCA1_54500 [Novosphingobium sp. TCA1]
MDLPRQPFDSRRRLLCSRSNADRLAEQMCMETAMPYAVVRTTCALQPYRVVRAQEARQGDDIEHRVIAL